MRDIPFNIIIKQQIQEEISKLLKKINVEELGSVQQHATSMTVESENVLSNLPISKMVYPALESILQYRLISGGEPTKLTQNQIYIHPAMAYFDDLNNPVITDGTYIDIPSYAEDRWVWIYLQKDGSFTANKYPPNIGDNQYRIAICKIWKEAGSDDFDERTLRDIRNVGFASANLNHLLRQVFLNMFLSIPKIQVENFSVVPTDEGDGNLWVQVTGLYTSVLYARLTPVADTKVQIPRPDVGETKHYFVLVSAQVDNYDPDDLKWYFKTKEIYETLSPQEYPIAIIYNVTNDLALIPESNIELVGISKQIYENYLYSRRQIFLIEGNDTEEIISDEYMDVPYLNTIKTAIVKSEGIESVKLYIEGKENREYSLNEGINYITVRIFPQEKIKVKVLLQSGLSQGKVDLELFVSTQI